VSEITRLTSASAAEIEIHGPPSNPSTAIPNNASTSAHTLGSSNLCNSGDATASNTTSSDPNGHDFSIRSWNVAGRLASNLSHPAFLSGLPLPPGYDVFAVARTPSLTFEKQWGGVVAIVRRGLGISLDDALSGPDLLVLRSGSVCIFNAYVLPNGSSWERWSPVHPLEKLEQSVAVAKIRGDAVVVIGDLNGRTGCRRASRVNHPSRFSLDATVNTQGRAILRFGEDYGLRILNGDNRFGSCSWGWTFAQKRAGRWCRSVIDYAMCDLAACAMVTNFEVDSGGEPRPLAFAR